MPTLAIPNLIPEKVPISLSFYSAFTQYSTPIPGWNGNITLWDLCPDYLFVIYVLLFSILSRKNSFLFFTFTWSINLNFKRCFKKKKPSFYFSYMQVNFLVAFQNSSLTQVSVTKALLLCCSLGSLSSTWNCRILWYSAHRLLSFNDKFYSWILMGPLLTFNCF